MPTDRDNAAFTRDDLIERSTVFQFHRDNLITDACLFSLFQVTRKLAGNWNQAFHWTPLGLSQEDQCHCGKLARDYAKDILSKHGAR